MIMLLTIETKCIVIHTRVDFTDWTIEIVVHTQTRACICLRSISGYFDLAVHFHAVEQSYSIEQSIIIVRLIIRRVKSSWYDNSCLS